MVYQAAKRSGEAAARKEERHPAIWPDEALRKAAVLIYNKIQN